MPKMSLLLGRKTMQVFDIDQTSIVVGRGEDADILIDNPSMSRRHAEFRQEGEGWVVQDLGSSNGTFIAGERLDGPKAVEEGTEVAFGKFSIVFGKAVGQDVPAPAAPRPTAPLVAAAEGTMHIQGHEVQALLKDAERKKRAHLVWEAGGQRGQHYLSEAPAALFGTDELCDVRWLAAFSTIKVNGQSTKKASLKHGDVVEAKGLKLTFVGDIA